ncbi:MAG: hypothetical protein RSG95_03190 [Bacilli bacterium]
MTKVVEQFNEAMRQIYDKSKELTPPYRPTRFKKMVDERGGKQVADELLSSPDQIHDGLVQLTIRGKEALKLTVEYLVLKPEYSSLFTPEQKAIAKKRLLQLNVDLPE